jgi:hypothetical protein
MSRRLTWLLPLGLLLAGLALLAAWAAEQQVAIRGVFAVAAANGRVLLSAGSEVVLTDEQGTLLAVLSDAQGAPWRFQSVSNVSFGRDGSPIVCDSERHQLVRFQPDGRGATLVPLDAPPRLSFEALELADGYLIADTMGHELRRIDAAGKTQKRRPLRYPNALQLASNNPEQIALVSTGAAKAFRYDATTLELVPDATLTAVSDSRARGTTKRELFELAILPDGRAIAADCRDT